MPKRELPPFEEGNLDDPEAALRAVTGAGPMLERPPAPEPIPMPDVEAKPENSVPPMQNEETEMSEGALLRNMLKEKMALPGQEEIDQLKREHRVDALTVVPLISDNAMDNVPFVIVKPLTRAQWRGASTVIRKRIEAGQVKGEVDPEELFAGKIVSDALVYPKMIEAQFDSNRAGMVPSLFGVINRISWFFDPEKLLNLSITL